ncbi:MAG: ThuA domain-containing protein [Planctomycetota bacterium]
MKTHRHILIAGLLAAIAFLMTGVWHHNPARAADIPDKQVKKIKRALPDQPIADPSEERQVLIFTLCKGFTHNSIPAGTVALKMLGEQTGAYTADVSDDMSVFSEENLEKYDAIILNNTTRLGFKKESRREALMNFVKEDGKGLIGFHAAADNFYEWEEARSSWAASSPDTRGAAAEHGQ